MIAILQLILILAVGAFVLTPLVRFRGLRIAREAATANRHRSILERKNRVYQQMVDLDFDKDSGKLSSEDHARMREETMAEAVQVLAEEEALETMLGRGKPGAPHGRVASSGSAPGGAPATPSAVSDQVERMIEDMKKRRAAEGLHS